MRLGFAIAALAVALIMPSFASPPGAASADSGAKAPSPAARIADVAWLAGYWKGEGLGGEVEDVWLPPRSGVLLGAFRLTRPDGKPGFYEIFAIEEVEETLQFVVKHFNPDWVSWEEKDKALRVRLTRLSADEIAFGGIVFRRESPDGLQVKLTIRQKGGEIRHETLAYRRKPL